MAKRKSYLHYWVDYYILAAWLGSKNPPDIINYPYVVSKYNQASHIEQEKLERQWAKYWQDAGHPEYCETQLTFIFRKNYFDDIVKKKGSFYRKEYFKINKFVTEFLKSFQHAFKDNIGKKYFAEQLCHYIADYKALLHIKKILDKSIDKRLKHFEAKFLLDYIKKDRGKPPRGNILLKKLCKQLNGLREKMKHPKLVFQIIPYTLRMTDVFTPDRAKDKCLFKKQEKIDERLFCSKTHCIEHRLKKCAETNSIPTGDCSPSECSDCKGWRKSPFLKGLCPSATRIFQYMSKADN